MTGSELSDRVQDASHGAGQIRPVNSGKLFVACKDWIASSQLPWYIRSLNSGIKFPRGHPLLQNGTPQSIQRPACLRASESSHFK